ncbi:C2H2 type zinc finger domain-containing protein [Sodiomyces alkalinus F11]|uniref:C2H2 type zinc finger domain-containing protein n=1 Tax=Sodiomyces alkalinus (strain CBS 110278 / VKM F-3762 / F11) TaxID=1314773 RepID=A0A3N2PWH7_SODAK|nr:C2H2 type zinc finger domain-containing protein [Sodiomyces alkalinus F11]ROT38847.1 C2H2 type zinc finger domain-containing protein [Sodiomyces alkalinus F11]
MPPTTTAAIDSMGIDGPNNTPSGGFVCKFAGCTAPPFQTQYLLNSHANVHSSARPHYCSVTGCPRSEGGKGFKRKNEMIRHGLVHESPGYICPFCPDRDHKYPRPDNLQRHVRVHHVDKHKDDPLLREVLSQRPDGPNRGRRRRGNGF